MFKTLLAVALAGVSLCAGATSAGYEVQRQNYQCDTGGRVRATYYFGAPKAYVVISTRNGQRRLYSDSTQGNNETAVYTDGRMSWTGQNLFEDKLSESNAQLSQRIRTRVNGRVTTVDNLINKGCVASPR